MDSDTVKEQEIKGVILAAGKGSRMGLLPSALPKPVLPILNRPIIYHQLSAMARLGIKTVFLVVGHQGYLVVREIERLPSLGLSIHYLSQDQTLGIAHCVGQLEASVDGPFLMFLGDIYFEAPRMEEMVRLFRKPGVDGVLGAVHTERLDEIKKNFSIIEDHDGRVSRVIEKPRYPKTDLKGTGLYLFSPVIFDAIRRTPRTAMRDEYEITDSIQIMIDDGYRLLASTCIDADLNVTYPGDLLDINLRLLESRGLSRLLGENVTLGAGSEVTESVVGDGVEIGAGAKVSRSVLFAGVKVPNGAELDRVVLTREGQWKK
ncbi:MAG: NTP transferase domain-containing protein [Deltaproteobacteria bacterium]|nr:NTP transferase domain-containing protein [Deltaproteobacteria bacterium]